MVTFDSEIFEYFEYFNFNQFLIFKRTLSLDWTSPMKMLFPDSMCMKPKEIPVVITRR